MTKEEVEAEYLKNKKLIYYVANKFRGRDEMEELVSKATIYFLEALQDYEKSTKECKLSTFTVCYMYRGLVDYTRKLDTQKRKAQVVSLSKTIADNLELQEVIADTTDYEENIIHKIQLENALTDIELEILKRLCRKEKHSEIKKALNIKQSVLNVHIKNIKEKIKKL